MKRLNDVQEDILERLFANELEPDDRARIGKELADPDFKAELGFRNALKKVAEKRRMEDPLRQELQRIRAANKGGNGSLRRLYYSAAAVILLLIAAAIGLPSIDILGIYKKGSLAELPDEAIPGLIKLPTDLTQASQTQDPGEDNYKNGRIQFRQAQYQAAIGPLEQVPAESRYYHVSQFLLAHCYLYTGSQVDKAVKIFETFKIEMNAQQKLIGEYDYDSDKVNWNLMLAYKRAGLQDQYTKLLQFLANDPNYIFRQEAIQLRIKELGK